MFGDVSGVIANGAAMRASLPVLFLCTLLAESALAAADAYPLWDGRESMETYARRAHLSPTKSIDLGSGVTLDFVLVPAGQFIMGVPEPKTPAMTVEGCERLMYAGFVLLSFLSVVQLAMALRRKRFAFSLRWLMLFVMAAGLAVGGGFRARWARDQWFGFELAKAEYEYVPADERPGHSVTITQPFYLSRDLLTFDHYEMVMFQSRYSNVLGGPKYLRLEWRIAVRFCDDLTLRIREKLPESATCKLPTEAQWEYACGINRKTAPASIVAPPTPAPIPATTSVSTFGVIRSGTRPAAAEPHGLGLNGMEINIPQWCHDWYDYDSYSRSPAEDATGPESGIQRVYRGGDSHQRRTHSFTERGAERPSGYAAAMRVVLTAPPPGAK
jgi:hypothetical protein